MLAHFNILLSDEVDKFLKELDEKIREKIFYNIDKAMAIREIYFKNR